MNNAMRQVRTALPWLLLGIVSVLATLLVMLPAAWITPQFAKATGGHVNMVDPQGSLWKGSAMLMLAAGSDPAGATLLPGRIEWTTEFWPLFTGHVRMTMRQSDAMPDPVNVDASLRAATLSSGAIKVPASLLTGLGAPFNTLDLDGRVELAWTDWRTFGREAFGQLTVTLDDMSSRVSQVKPLGSYRLLLQAQGPDATFDLSTLKGALLLNGHGMSQGGAMSFQGTASSTPEAHDSLAGLLNLLGRPSGPNTIALTFMR